MSNKCASERAKIGALARSRPADDPELIAARRDLAASRLSLVITETVAAAPPLTPEQRNRLVLLIQDGVTEADILAAQKRVVERKLRYQRRRAAQAEKDAATAERELAALTAVSATA